MPRKIIKKIIPHPSRILHNPVIKKLGPKLQDPGIWHINRRSVSGAVAVGLFCAFMPIPFQMLLAAAGAILFRVNILISVPMVWISNPVTITPLFYFCYQVGAWILHTDPSNFNFELSVNWLLHELHHIWQPFLLGCLIVALASAVSGFITIRIIWRLLLWKHLLERKKRKNP